MSSHEYYYPQVLFHVAASWHSKRLVRKPELHNCIAGFWLRGILCCQHDVWPTNGMLCCLVVLLVVLLSLAAKLYQLLTGLQSAFII